MGFELDSYRRRAESFSEQLSREYYLHLAGRKADLDLEPIYSGFAELFTPDAAARLRELTDRAPDGDEQRRLRYLLHFCVEGLIGAETRAESAELARLEAALEVDPGDRPIPYRAVPVEQANEPDQDRRGRLEAERNRILEERLNPLHRRSLERAHDVCRACGWSSYVDAHAELRDVDLEGLAGQARRFLEATEDRYPGLVDPQLERQGLPTLGGLRRCDLPRFFRAEDLDRLFPAERPIESLRETLAGLGIALDRQPNIHLDTESRPSKSARAFCSTPRVPGEVHLVIAPHGGRDDYSALFHEAGHAEHYAHVDPHLPVEFRRLGDNSVTESFAFLLEHLLEEPRWLRAHLAVDDPAPAVAQGRASRLLLVRRYCGKLAYELELHSRSSELDRMPSRYAELLAEATRIPWPREAWLADVDDGFYAACYLRAWALAARWRAAVRARYGEEWFTSGEAGEWLRGLWRRGQRLDADELLADAVGGELDLGDLASDF